MRTFEPDPDAGTPGESDSERSAGRLSPFRILFRIVAGLVIAASFAVWVYAYSGLARRDTPDLLADRELAADAEQICAATLADVATMPNALEAANGEERAQQIRRATARFELMVNDLDGLAAFDERDERIFRGWLSDWRVLLSDRVAYADRIAADPNAQFYISDIGGRERLDRRLTRFANTNLMVSCAAPTDV
ncbi:MAG: hypothetical protein ACR2QK_00530 [Acidimicrobiales bacterium]